MITATINRETLSDGSFVYRVDLKDDGERITELDAYSENDAAELARKLTTAICDHACVECSNATYFTY